MVKYISVRSLPTNDRFLLRMKLRGEYAFHKRKGYVNCLCSEEIHRLLERYGICDKNDVVDTTVIKRLIAACG